MVGMDTEIQRKRRDVGPQLWLRTVLSALCLWSDVSRGHDRLLALCPVSETASLWTETGTCVGPSSGAHTALSSVHGKWASDA